MINFPDRPASGWLNCPEKNRGECNSVGFRGQKISYTDNDYVVLLLGDSEVYAAAFPFDQMPERILEHALKQFKRNVKVFTIGDLGYGQDQQLLALKQYYRKYRADLVLLMVTARNDIENNIFPVAGANFTVKPTFWLSGNALKGPSEGWLQPVGNPFKLVLLWQIHVGKTIGEAREAFWEKNILPPPYQPLNAYNGFVDPTWHDVWKNNPEKAFKGIEFEKTDIGNQLQPPSERRRYGIELTRRLFEVMRKLVESKDGRFIIFKEERPWELKNREREKAYLLKGMYYIVSMKQYQENLRDLFDNFEHFRIPINIENYTVTPENKHLNEQAVDSMMKRLAVLLSGGGYLRFSEGHK